MRTSWLAGASSDAECPSFTQPTPPNENHQYNQIITCCIICLNSLQLKDTNNDNTDTSFWWTDSVLLCPSIKRWSCLTCLLRTSGLRTERPRKTKLGTEVAHITRDWDTTFKVKGQSSRSPGRFTYRGVTLTCRAAAAVSMGTYWPWEPTATLWSALCRRSWLGSASVPTEGKGQGILWRPPVYSLFVTYVQNTYVWYGIVEFNVPLDTV